MAIFIPILTFLGKTALWSGAAIGAEKAINYGVDKITGNDTAGDITGAVGSIGAGLASTSANYAKKGLEYNGQAITPEVKQHMNKFFPNLRSEIKATGGLGFKKPSKGAVLSTLGLAGLSYFLNNRNQPNVVKLESSNTEEPGGQIEIKGFDQTEPITTSGVIDIPQSDDMTYSDILATSMLGRLDMKAPISNQTIASNLASLASMSRMESGLAFAVKRGDKVDFKDDYGKQMNMLLGYARTINDPNASEAEKDAATAAANVGTYGLDIYKQDADDMNKQAMRTEQIIKGYSKASNNAPMIQSLQKEITKYDKMIKDSEDGLAKDLSDLAQKGVGTGKANRPATRADEVNIASAWQPSIDAAKLRRKQYEDKMIELQNSERRTGTFQEYLNSIKSVKGQSGVKTYTPNWDKSKGEVFGKSDLDRMAKDLNLGQAQKTALAITIQEESGFNTGTRNMNDGGKTSVGLYGMRDDRELGLVNYAKSIGVRPESKEAQIGYAKIELNDPSLWTGGVDSIKQFNNAKTTEEALTILTNKFIRPSVDNAISRIERFKNTTIN